MHHVQVTRFLRHSTCTFGYTPNRYIVDEVHQLWGLGFPAHHTVFDLRSSELSFVETFGENAPSLRVPKKNPNLVGALVKEDEQPTLDGISAEDRMHGRLEPIETSAEVDRRHGEIDFCACRNQRRTSSVSSRTMLKKSSG